MLPWIRVFLVLKQKKKKIKKKGGRKNFSFLSSLFFFSFFLISDFFKKVLKNTLIQGKHLHKITLFINHIKNSSTKFLAFDIQFSFPPDFVDTSGLRFYYSNPRKYDAAVLMTGSAVSARLLIPPNLSSWAIEGFCPKECSEVSVKADFHTIKFFEPTEHFFAC